MSKESYQKYYVAFLDILGFKEIVENDNFEKINSLIGKYDKEYIMKLLNLGLDDINDEEDLAANYLKIVQFSDSIIVSVPSDVDYSFDTLLVAVRDLIADCFISHGILLRGGITEGNFYINDNKIFGTALNEAYKLENSSAIYPRVIFTEKTLYNYKKKCLGSMPCKSIAEIDEDGYYFVDYLFSINWDFLLPKERIELIQKYEDINEKIVQVYTDLLSKVTDNHVRGKYLWLKKYYKNTQIKIYNSLKKAESKTSEEVIFMNIGLLVSNIKKLCNQKNVSIDKMLKECNLKPSVVDNMKKGSFPSVDKIYSIARYFDVSVEYLLECADDVCTNSVNFNKLSDREMRCLRAFNNLLFEDKIEFIARMEQRYEDYSAESKENV